MSIKLEVGKTYVARDGHLVTIISQDNTCYPFNGSNEDYYVEDGSYYLEEAGESDYDLIREHVFENNAAAEAKAKKQLSTIRSMAATMGARKRKHAKELAAVNAVNDALSFQLVAEQAKYGDLREDVKAMREWCELQRRKESALRRDAQSEVNRGDKWCCAALVLFAIVVGQAVFMVWGQS